MTLDEGLDELLTSLHRSRESIERSMVMLIQEARTDRDRVAMLEYIALMRAALVDLVAPLDAAEKQLRGDH